MSVISYGAGSPYAATPQTSWNIGRFVFRPVPPDSGDTPYTLTSRHQYRPDRLSYDLYKTPNYWWIFSARNPFLRADPVWSFLPGLEIMVPTAELSQSHFGNLSAMGWFDKPLLQTMFGSSTAAPTAAPANVATPPPMRGNNRSSASSGHGHSASVPEASTPHTAVPPAAAPLTVAPTVTASVAGPSAPPMATSTQALINQSVDENCLNAYFQSTYHFRLFAAPDTDLITQTGATSITGLNDAMNDIRQVTIAESGVTGFNIKDVSLTTVVAGNGVTRADTAHTFSMTITEPGGISFLDALAEAGTGLQQKNYTKAPFYLQLTFLGYDETGAFVDNPASKFSTSGRWTWALTCTNIDIKLNEGGAVYNLSFQTSNSAYLTDVYDLTRTPQSFFAIGNNIKDLFADYISKLNAAWKTKYNGDLVVFDGIDVSAVGKYFTHPAWAAGKDPSTFDMKGPASEKNTNRSWEFTKGAYSVNVTPGYTVSEFIMDAIKHTEEGQNLAKADTNATAEDHSAAKVNSSNIRESITWVIEPILKVNSFDRTTGNYIKHITFVVSPYYTQNVLLTRPQADTGKAADVQYNMVANYIQNGLFRKKYEYIFTGLNTEVLDFDLNWKMQYNSIVAAYSGALMRTEALKVHQRQNADNKQPNNNLSTVTSKVVAEPLINGTSTGTPSAAVPAASPQATSQFTRVAAGNANTPEAKRAVTRIYIEDLLSQQVADNPNDYAVPISFWQGNRDVENNAGSSIFPGQADRVQTVVGSVFNQIYSDSMPTNAFQTIKLSIRGDPYWLGQSNLHRQILLLHNDTDVKRHDLPNHATGPQVVYIHFRYPVQTRDDFKPELSSSTVFNGVYSVTTVVHNFSDGIYKQELNCVKVNLIDPSQWGATTTTSASPSAGSGTGGAASSKQQVGNSGPVPPSDGTSIGSSPVAGKDYKPGDKASFVTAFTPLAQAQSARTGVAPEIILAQAGLETGWGASAPQNNFFGIKATAASPGASLSTTEVTNGVTQTVNQNFAANTSAAASFQAYGDLMNTSKYSGVSSASGLDAQAFALGRSGYATDPSYGTKISSIANSIKIPQTVASKP